MHVPIKVDYGVRALVDLAMYGSDGNALEPTIFRIELPYQTPIWLRYLTL